MSNILINLVSFNDNFRWMIFFKKKTLNNFCDFIEMSLSWLLYQWLYHLQFKWKDIDMKTSQLTCHLLPLYVVPQSLNIPRCFRQVNLLWNIHAQHVNVSCQTFCVIVMCRSVRAITVNSPAEMG